MSREFIGSKIAVVTKSQCRYVGTIIGIDAQTSSIILGNAKCFGTENRAGHLPKGHMAGTILPIMQFANSDIEDLKIVDEDQLPETPQQQSYAMPAISSPPPAKQPSIHDDPAIVSAVISSSNKDNTSNSSLSSRLMHNLQHMTLSDEKSKILPKNEESHMRSNSGELATPWSLLAPAKWENNNNHPKSSSQQRSDNNKSKFFDDFISGSNNNTNQFQFNRSHQRSSNTHSTQTSRENSDYNNGQYDDNGLPVRQPFFGNDRPYPQKEQQQQNRYHDDSIQQQHRYHDDSIQQHQQQNRYHNDNMQQHQQQNRYHNGNTQQNQQRYFYNNRRTQMPNQQRRMGGGGGGNRETFQDNPTDYENDFDFETSNLKFNKLTSEDDSKHQTDLTPNQFIQPQIDIESTAEHPALYDKKKSFFDNLAVTTASDAPTSYGYNRSKNSDTFGNDGYQRQNNRSNGGGGGGYRRPNNNYRRQQYGDDDFQYRQHNNNNNGYHYRY